MKILLTGGGSGGHVTPLKAIIEALPDNDTHQITVVTDRKFFTQTKKIFENHPDVIIKKIFAGKYRRYSGKSFVWHITNLPLILKNLRDILLLKIGFFQSLFIILTKKPDVVFAKGGFVSLPVGLAAHILKKPLYIHDSDTRPGLTSRVLAKWAKTIATGMPPEFYPYKKDKLLYTGMPADQTIKPQSPSERKKLKRELHLSEDRPLLLVTGGGTGARSLNLALAAIARELISEGWQIVHITGRGKSGEVRKICQTLPDPLQAYWTIEEFIDIAPYVNAASLVLTRAGANAMQEFANAKKPVIIVPGMHLSDQIKNAQMFLEKKAALVLEEPKLRNNPELLFETITKLWKDQHLKDSLATKLHQEFAKPDAASKLAKLITKQ